VLCKIFVETINFAMVRRKKIHLYVDSSPFRLFYLQVSRKILAVPLELLINPKAFSLPSGYSIIYISSCTITDLLATVRTKSHTTKYCLEIGNSIFYIVGIY
jgi:hypothetical protein